ncbi:MAG: acyltransferase [Phormidesmis priestleyi]|uniref:Acyltransferase n=1 Tax=Phormidesmis priestleyi TaxID=268141 RepID=A0A2W4WS29_9CYAN|nr:MAG: acyltransferase [Phormidesmis priestleyi]
MSLAKVPVLKEFGKAFNSTIKSFLQEVYLLRFIGLAAIIFAHSGPPGLLFQLRNFDVPLMVLASAMSFDLSYRAGYPYLQYVFKRIKRLAFPVWLFLTFYFLGQFAILHSGAELSLKAILGSYALIDGIGYVWIIRVFLLVALAAPILWTFHKKTPQDSRFFGSIAIATVAYELLRFIVFPHIQGGPNQLASLFIIQPIPYFIVFLIGLRMRMMGKAQIYTLAAVNFAAFVAIGTGLYLHSGGIVQTQVLKYPPELYYISYALFISTLLWLLSRQIWNRLEQVRAKGLVLFVASNSMWIYLWHIPFVKMVQANFLSKYLIVFSAAFAIVYLQNWVVSNLVLPRLHSDRSRKSVKALLMG